MTPKAIRILALILLADIIISAVVSFVTGSLTPIVSAVLLAAAFLLVKRISDRNAEEVERALSPEESPDGTDERSGDQK